MLILGFEQFTSLTTKIASFVVTRYVSVIFGVGDMVKCSRRTGGIFQLRSYEHSKFESSFSLSLKKVQLSSAQALRCRGIRSEAV